MALTDCWRYWDVGCACSVAYCLELGLILGDGYAWLGCLLFGHGLIWMMVVQLMIGWVVCSLKWWPVWFGMFERWLVWVV